MRCPECASAIDDPAPRVCPTCGIWLPGAPETLLRPSPPPIAPVRPSISRADGFDPATQQFSTVTELDLEPEVVPFEPSVSTLDGRPDSGGPPMTLPPIARRTDDTPPQVRFATPPPSERPTDALVRVPPLPPRAHRSQGETVESPLRAFIDGRTAEVAAPLVRFYVMSKQREAAGDVDGAIRCLEDALELAEDPALYNRLGILFARGKHDAARACRMFARAVELAPEDRVYERNLRKAERQRARARGE